MGSAHTSNIHSNAFSILLNPTNNNTAIAQEHEHVHMQEANQLSNLLTKPNQPNGFSSE